MSKIVRARKIDILVFIRRRKVVGWWDLREYFRYTDKSAIGTLYRLKKQGLIANFGRGQYTLTDDGYRRLDYYGR
jgi:Mn-dependent DtxR family transcriptional regulator